MAERFNLTAQIQLQAPSNTAQVVNQIREQLKNITVDVKVKSNVREVAQLNKELRGVDRAGAASAKSVSRLNGTLDQAARRFTTITIATGSFLALARAIKNGVKEAIAFEKELIKISQVTGKTTDRMQGLTREVTQLSVSLGASSSDLLNVSRTLAQAGFSAQKTTQALETLAQTSLAATFSSIQDTTEGAIAVLRQFSAEARASGGDIKFLASTMDAINSVSKNFAVESDDLITAIRRVGGVFSAAGGKVNELIALFTSVRATTRESAETIATGLRTIFTRIQRTDTVDQLKALGIQLRDSEGQFVGAYEAVRRLSAGLSVLDPRDFRFSEIVESLGGFRQIGKVIPLIQQFSVAQNALNIAQNSSGSVARDAATAQQGLGVQITKVKEEFAELMRKFSDSTTFKSVVKGALAIASAIIKITSALENVLPLIMMFATMKLGQALGRGPLRRLAGGLNQGGKVHAFARGGFVPGTGDRDTVPAMLSPGEFVIKKSSAKKLGAGTLAAMNENRFEAGGTVASGRHFYGKKIGPPKDKYHHSHLLAGRPATLTKAKGQFAGKKLNVMTLDNLVMALPRNINTALSGEKEGNVLGKDLYKQIKAMDATILFRAQISGTGRGGYGDISKFPEAQQIMRQKVEVFKKAALGAIDKKKVYNHDADLAALGYAIKAKAGPKLRKALEAVNEVVVKRDDQSDPAVQRMIAGKTKKGGKGRSQRILRNTEIDKFKFKNLGGLIQKFKNGGGAQSLSPTERKRYRFLNSKKRNAEERAEHAKLGARLKGAGAAKTKTFDSGQSYGGVYLERTTSPQSGVKTVTFGRKKGKEEVQVQYDMNHAFLDPADGAKIKKQIVAPRALDAINDTANYLAGLIGESAAFSGNVPNLQAIAGSVFEAGLARVSKEKLALDADDKRTFDFAGGLRNASKIFGSDGAKLQNIKTDAKVASTKSALDSIRGKVKTDLTGLRSSLGFAMGGSVGSDTVPAMLTPGEFVINKSAAQGIGYSNLNKMNRRGVTGFEAGGTVTSGRHFYGMDLSTGLPTVRDGVRMAGLGIDWMDLQGGIGKLIDWIGKLTTVFKLLKIPIDNILGNSKKTAESLKETAEAAEEAADSVEDLGDAAEDSSGGSASRGRRGPSRFQQGVQGLDRFAGAAQQFVFLGSAAAALGAQFSELEKTTQDAISATAASMASFVGMAGTLIQVFTSVAASNAAAAASEHVETVANLVSAESERVETAANLTKATKSKFGGLGMQLGILAAGFAALATTVTYFRQVTIAEAAALARGVEEAIKRLEETGVGSGKDLAERQLAQSRKGIKSKEESSLFSTGLVAAAATHVGVLAAAIAAFFGVVAAIPLAIIATFGVILGGLGGWFGAAGIATSTATKEAKEYEKAMRAGADANVAATQNLRDFNESLRELEERRFADTPEGRAKKIEARGEIIATNLKRRPDTDAAIRHLVEISNKLAAEPGTGPAIPFDRLQASDFEGFDLMRNDFENYKRVLEKGAENLKVAQREAQVNLTAAMAEEITGEHSVEELRAQGGNFAKAMNDMELIIKLGIRARESEIRGLLENEKLEKEEKKALKTELEEITSERREKKAIGTFRSDMSDVGAAAELRWQEDEKIAEAAKILRMRLEALSEFTKSVKRMSQTIDDTAKRMTNVMAVLSDEKITIEMPDIPGLRDVTNIADTGRFDAQIDRLIQDLPEAFRTGAREAAQAIGTSNRIFGEFGRSLIGRRATTDEEVVPRAEGILEESGLNITNPELRLGILSKLQDALRKKFGITESDVEDIFGFLREEAEVGGKNLQELNKARAKDLKTYTDFLASMAKLRAKETEARQNLVDVNLRGQIARTDARAGLVDPVLAERGKVRARELARTEKARLALRGTDIQAGNARSAFAALQRARVGRMAAVNQMSGLDEGSNKFKSLAVEMSNYEETIKRANEELGRLANQTDRVQDLLGQVKEQKDIRKSVGDVVTNFVVGGRRERMQISRALRGIQFAFRTGTLQRMTPNDRKSTVDMLRKLKNVPLKMAGGMTGEQVLNRLIVADARRLGIDEQTIKALYMATSKEEELIQSIDRLTRAMEEAALLQAKAAREAAEAAAGAEAGQAGQGGLGPVQPLPGEVPRGAERGGGTNMMDRDPRDRRRAQGGLIYRADGGPSSVFQSRGTDTVPAMLTPGEFVVKRSAVNRIGVDNLHALNNGVQYKQGGGLVRETPQQRENRMVRHAVGKISETALKNTIGRINKQHSTFWSLPSGRDSLVDIQKGYSRNWNEAHQGTLKATRNWGTFKSMANELGIDVDTILGKSTPVMMSENPSMNLAEVRLIMKRARLAKKYYAKRAKYWGDLVNKRDKYKDGFDGPVFEWSGMRGGKEEWDRQQPLPDIGGEPQHGPLTLSQTIGKAKREREAAKDKHATTGGLRGERGLSPTKRGHNTRKERGIRALRTFQFIKDTVGSRRSVRKMLKEAQIHSSNRYLFESGGSVGYFGGAGVLNLFELGQILKDLAPQTGAGARIREDDLMRDYWSPYQTYTLSEVFGEESIGRGGGDKIPRRLKNLWSGKRKKQRRERERAAKGSQQAPSSNINWIIGLLSVMMKDMGLDSGIDLGKLEQEVRDGSWFDPTAPFSTPGTERIPELRGPDGEVLEYEKPMNYPTQPPKPLSKFDPEEMPLSSAVTGEDKIIVEDYKHRQQFALDLVTKYVQSLPMPKNYGGTDGKLAPEFRKAWEDREIERMMKVQIWQYLNGESNKLPPKIAQGLREVEMADIEGRKVKPFPHTGTLEEQGLIRSEEDLEGIGAEGRKSLRHDQTPRDYIQRQLAEEEWRRIDAGAPDKFRMKRWRYNSEGKRIPPWDPDNPSEPNPAWKDGREIGAGYARRSDWGDSLYPKDAFKGNSRKNDFVGSGDPGFNRGRYDNPIGKQIRAEAEIEAEKRQVEWNIEKKGRAKENRKKKKRPQPGGAGSVKAGRNAAQRAAGRRAAARRAAGRQATTKDKEVFRLKSPSADEWRDEASHLGTPERSWNSLDALDKKKEVDRILEKRRLQLEGRGGSGIGRWIEETFFSTGGRASSITGDTENTGPRRGAVPRDPFPIERIGHRAIRMAWNSLLEASTRQMPSRAFASGGRASSITGDTVPAMLTPGEFVMSKEAVQSHGVGYMKNLNRGYIPGFRRGGVVGRGDVQYKAQGGFFGGGDSRGDAGVSRAGSSLNLDTSNLSDILSGFNTNLVNGLDSVILQFIGFSESFTRLSESFSSLNMTHTFNGDLSLAFNITNTDAIKYAVADAISPRITEIISRELDIRLNKDFKGGAG